MVALVLTATGWQQVMIYKQPALPKLAVWFPSLLLIRFPDEMLRVLLTLVQFHLFAAAFAVGIRRWRVATVAITLLIVYTLCVFAAFATLRAQ